MTVHWLKKDEEKISHGGAKVQRHGEEKKIFLKNKKKRIRYYLHLNSLTL